MLNKFLDDNKDLFYFLFRVLVGAMFLMHGAQKFGLLSGGFSLPGEPLMLLAAIIEFFGGLAILLGTYVRISSVLSGITMIAAYFMAHASKGLNPLVNGGELALLYLAAFLVLATVGPGKKWAMGNN